jgi:HD superfamily phosphodiesterase
MWKGRILDFARKLNHPAWGFSHLQRVHDMALRLAKEEGTPIDEEVIFAAAFLHDVGALEPYKKIGVEHAVRSAEFCEEVLQPMGFPEEKVAVTRDVILGHMFYVSPELKEDVIVFRDADILDYLGYIGIARMLAMVKHDDWTPDMGSAIALIKSISAELPQELYTASAKTIGQKRALEMEIFLKGLSAETNTLEML